MIKRGKSLTDKSIPPSPVMKLQILAATLVLLASLFVPQAGQAQVNGPGPSPSSSFDVVLNLPGDENVVTGADDEGVGGVDGQTIQLNVNQGTVGNVFQTRFGSEVNIIGGVVGESFITFTGSEVNISGGTVGNFFTARSGSVVNISGGTFGPNFTAINGSVVNISGGTVGTGFFAGTVGAGSFPDTEVNISGGTLGNFFDANVGSEVNISGGVFGDFFDANTGSVVNISGGTGNHFDANIGSVVNISGGVFGEDFDSFPGSVVNLRGSAFSIDGTPLDNLQLGQPVTITERDITLSGVLSDGQPFSFTLAQGNSSALDHDFFSPNATLTVTLEASVLLGDVNQDGSVTFFDIAPFIAALANGEFIAEADIDQNGIVDFFDIQPFIDILSNAQ